MDWNGVTTALGGAMATVALTVVWSIIERRRAATQQLVEDMSAVVDILFETVSRSGKALLRQTRGRTWLHAFIAVESARKRLLIHLGPRRWRSQRTGLRATLIACREAIEIAAIRHATDDSDETREAFLDEIKVDSATLGRWVAHRRSFWRGDISQELRRTLGKEARRPRGPGWWRWSRPGRPAI